MSNELPRGWRKPSLTPAQWDEIRDRYAEGESSATLAAAFGVTAAYIRQRFSRQLRGSVYE